MNQSSDSSLCPYNRDWTNHRALCPHNKRLNQSETIIVHYAIYAPIIRDWINHCALCIRDLLNHRHYAPTIRDWTKNHLWTVHQNILSKCQCKSNLNPSYFSLKAGGVFWRDGGVGLTPRSACILRKTLYLLLFVEGNLNVSNGRGGEVSTHVLIMCRTLFSLFLLMYFYQPNQIVVSGYTKSRPVNGIYSSFRDGVWEKENETFPDYPKSFIFYSTKKSRWFMEENNFFFFFFNTIRDKRP